MPHIQIAFEFDFTYSNDKLSIQLLPGCGAYACSEGSMVIGPLKRQPYQKEAESELTPQSYSHCLQRKCFICINVARTFPVF